MDGYTTLVCEMRLPGVLLVEPPLRKFFACSSRSNLGTS